jgi:uncharacterized protein YecE (DUF72 family)
MLKHYNIAGVLVDVPINDKLGFISDVTVTANHSFIRFHGRDSRIRYNYVYSKDELALWESKIS